MVEGPTDLCLVVAGDCWRTGWAPNGRGNPWLGGEAGLGGRDPREGVDGALWRAKAENWLGRGNIKAAELLSLTSG